jgi:putative peptide zinc metalloprotease protein
VTPFDGPGAPAAPAPASEEATAPPSGGAGAVPVRAEGVQLLGAVPGSGYRVAPALVRRGDGQTIQLTPLLYAVLEQVDGRRTTAEVAEAVGAAVGRQVSAADVEMLCDGKLRTLGVLKKADGSDPEVRRSNPLLALRFKYVVSDPEATRRITAPFAMLFAPVVVVVLVAAFFAVCGWVLLHKGLASAAHQAFDQPALLLTVFALTVVSAGFHEFGHAAAARYGGSTPGAMGTGLYLVWPAFYTDVTDSYRLGRAARVRTDLGGLYFNAIVAVAMFGVWWATGWDAILLIIATQVLQMVRQLAPLVRFDGYHVLADLTGVPDLYHRIKPTLVGLLPRHWNDPEARVLKPWARAVVTAWVVLVVPLLLFSLVMMVLSFPRVAGTAWASVGRQWARLETQLGDGDVLAVLVRALSILAIALPVLGVVSIVGRVARQVVSGTWRATDDHPVRRALAGMLALAVVAGLAWSWWPQPGTYRPIQAYERGTLADGVSSTLRSGVPATLQEGRQGAGRAVWPQGAALPTAEAPQLAVVMVPRGGRAQADGQPPLTWVFPFNRPLPPGDGGNQAMAVNTTDGSTLYDVAFALVWADGDPVANTNEAYALASCTGCQTVAVAFQVVLILGDANVVVPANVAAAVNYSCVQCVTQALATQLVVTLSGPLSAQSTADLAELWKEISAFGAAIQGVPLSELQERLTEYERRILAIVQKDPAWVAPAAGNRPTPATTSTTGPVGTLSPTAGSTGSSTGGTPSSTSSSQSSSSVPGSSSSPDSSTSPTNGTDPTASSTQPAQTSATAAGGVADATPTP